MARHSGLVMLGCFLLKVLCVCAKLNLIYHYDLEAVYQKQTELLCKIETDKTVKEVIWYRLSDTLPKRPIYYYEPPKFNSSSPEYKNRVRLGSDQSSLVILSATLEDEGMYECHVAVARNGSNPEDEIPEEQRQTMKLTVHIPPRDMKLSTFTSNKNMTLTCRSSGSKPSTDIYWLVKRKNEVKEYRSIKTVTEYQGNLADTIGYFYYSLSGKDKGTVIDCIVSHSDTGTTIRDKVTIVAPALRHSVMMYFDWLGGEVPYSEYDGDIVEDEVTSPPSSGMVEVLVSPSDVVEANSSVIVTVTSDGSFPEPSYTWWSEDLDLRSGRVIRINSIEKSQPLYCLIENPIGRVVVSVQLTVSGSDLEDPTSDTSPHSGEVAVSGVLIIVIAFGSLVVILVAALLIYYFAFKPSNGKTMAPDEGEVDDFDSYVVKQKLPDDQPTGQTKISSLHVEPEMIISNEKQALLNTALESPTDSPPEKYRSAENDRTSSTSTSGYGGDVGGSNGSHSRPSDRRSSDEKKRAISQHLQDFDENASFVGGYGSSFGLDLDQDQSDAAAPNSEEYSTQCESSDESDAESHQSRASGIEGRYTLPHERKDSWEHIDVNQVVEAHLQPTNI